MGYWFIKVDKEYFVHSKGILPSGATTSPPSLRDEEDVSFTVDDGKMGVEAVNVARLDNGWILGSLHACERRTNNSESPQR